MSADEVLGCLDALARIGVEAWVDGGWGIDALLGRQTRPHDDLDLVVAAADHDAVSSALQIDGFEVERDLLPTAIAFRHPDGRGIDLHLIEPTSDGGGDQVLEDGSRWHYRSLVNGRIRERTIRCCSVETQLAAHLGYEPDDQDRADMRALAASFGLVLPPPYSA